MEEHLEKLSADELSYHRVLIGQLKVVQTILESWMNHLSAKYQLTPQDTITDTGQIKRGVNVLPEQAG